MSFECCMKLWLFGYLTDGYKYEHGHAWTKILKLGAETCGFHTFSIVAYALYEIGP